MRPAEFLDSPARLNTLGSRNFLARTIVVAGFLALSTAHAMDGAGTALNPYLVSNYSDLKLVGTSGYGLDAVYRLTNDIDAIASKTENLSDTVYRGFAPIGDENTYFTGAIHGGGHVIRNLNIHQDGSNYTTLICVLGVAGVVDSLGLVDVSITGLSINGSLVGSNRGTIRACYASGAMTIGDGAIKVGGLVGSNRGSIRTSHSSVAVTTGGSATNVGGLVGWNIGNIDTCYSSGTVVVGLNSSFVGGLDGYTDEGGGGTVTSSFWDTEASGFASTGSPLATGSATAAMHDPATFTGWDFGAAWTIYPGHTYPLLRAFLKPLAIATADSTKLYDGNTFSGGRAVFTPSVIVDTLIFGSLHFGGTSQGAKDTGSYTIHVDSGFYSTQEGYLISYAGANATLRINPVPLTIAGATASNKVYDGTTSATVTGGALAGVLNSEDVGFVLGTANFATKNVGTGKTVAVTGSVLNGTKAANYVLSEPTGLSADIAVDTILVTADPKNKLYGTSDPVLTYIGPVLFSGDSYSGALSRVAGDTVGKYAISLGTVGAGSNYVVKYVGDSLSITLKSITVTAISKTKVYGSADPALTYTSDGLVGTDAFTGTLARTAGDSVGKYAITQGGVSAGANYTVTFVGDSLAITKKPLTVATAIASNKVYDGTNSATVTGATLSGVVNSDDVSLVVGTATFANVAAGSAKPVTVTGSVLAGAKAGNYSLTEVAGLSADIAVKPLTIIGASASNKVYDGTNSATVTGGTLSGVLNSDDVTLSLGGATFANANAGLSKAVTVTGSVLTGSASGNYGVTDPTGLAADIDPLAVHVAAVPDSIHVSDSDPVFGYTHSALVGSDGFTGTLSRTPGSTVATYQITIGNLSAGANYTIDFTGASFKILARGGSTALAVKPVSIHKSTDLSISIPKAFAATATGTGSARLGQGLVQEGENGLTVGIALPKEASVSVSIFDNLGNLVISWSQEVGASQLSSLDRTSDGRRLLPVSWNLRASNGMAVPSGVYLWKIDAITVDGQKLETVKRLGVGSPQGR